jgi:hypothetical protein
MPKPRKQNIRKPEKRFFILCEGAKTEPLYFKELIKQISCPGNKVEIVLVDSKKNTCKELVKEGKLARKSKRDDVWVVVDKDGYTKHAEAFETARANNIEIAFSSISFETWVLCHFSYTAKQFLKSEDIIHYINEQQYFENGYSKSDPDLFSKLKDRLKTACKNAKKLKAHHESGNPGEKRHTLNPFTNVDELVEAIFALDTE